MTHTHRSHYFHLIWSTKKREPLIDDACKERIYPYIGGILRQQGASLIEIGGISNHVHLLIRIGTLDRFSELMRMIKADSSRFVHKEFPDKRNFYWQEGYGSFTVSYSQTDVVREYIRNQEKHHQHCSFEEEYVLFLEKNGIEYDPRFVFD